MRKRICFIFLISITVASGQLPHIDPTTFDYRRADSIALNFPKKKYKSYTELVGPLTEGLETDHEKFRVLFRWITDNISYSYSNRTVNADKVVKKGKAVCGGYSTLLKEMCDLAGIECEIVTGYSKTETDDISRPLKKTDHAWNSVKLYGKWYLLDVTWASGTYDDEKEEFKKSFNEQYYLTPPDVFVTKHYPKEKKWQLMDTVVRRSEFTKPPIYYSGYYENNITDLQPDKGIIKIRLKDTLEIKFGSGTEIMRGTIELGNEEFVYRPQIEKEGSTYVIRQKFEKAGVYELTLFLNGQAVGAYVIEIKE